MVNTLNNGGNVLLPVDTAGRVLELLLTIDQYVSKSLCYHYSSSLIFFDLLSSLLLFSSAIDYRYWSSNKLSFPVALLGYMSFNTVEFAKSQVIYYSIELTSFGSNIYRSNSRSI